MNFSKHKFIIAALVILVAVSVFAVTFETKKLDANSPDTIEQKLTLLFGDDAKGLQLLEKKQLDGKEISVYKGNKTFYDVDANGKLTGYQKLTFGEKPSTTVTLDQAQSNSVSFVKKVFPEEDINSFQLVTSMLEDHGDSKVYSFSWSRKNTSGVVIRFINVRTSLDGEIITYINADKSLADDKIVEKVSKDDAIKLANQKFNPAGEPNKKILNAEKIVLKGKLYWRVKVEATIGHNPPAIAQTSYFVDINTGELVDDPLK